MLLYIFVLVNPVVWHAYTRRNRKLHVLLESEIRGDKKPIVVHYISEISISDLFLSLKQISIKCLCVE